MPFGKTNCISWSVLDMHDNMRINCNDFKSKFSELWKINSWLSKKQRASWHLLVQSQQLKHHYNKWNLFKVNNKDTRTTSMTGKCRLGMHQLVQPCTLRHKYNEDKEIWTGIQLIFACWNSTIETLEKRLKYVKSLL